MIFLLWYLVLSNEWLIWCTDLLFTPSFATWERGDLISQIHTLVQKTEDGMIMNIYKVHSFSDLAPHNCEGDAKSSKPSSTSTVLFLLLRGIVNSNQSIHFDNSMLQLREIRVTTPSTSAGLFPLFRGRVAEHGSLSSVAKMAMKIFIKRVFTICASNASFLRVIANLQN